MNRIQLRAIGSAISRIIQLLLIGLFAFYIIQRIPSPVALMHATLFAILDSIHHITTEFYITFRNVLICFVTIYLSTRVDEPMPVRPGAKRRQWMPVTTPAIVPTAGVSSDSSSDQSVSLPALMSRLAMPELASFPARVTRLQVSSQSPP
ncbi:hypothetical protein BOTBODRAFT_573204 [Botryobasidium botryosum FD-172 SS1]|uniref:Uncharacterized protein n=1 Tax=Botryobasidium botryosum (strain FD-172 SS1) TaxID=930990 RepID=A0A067M8J7_BOTB1|nr:hypothetical protein BOTBODRAFT_573204 [Botryobasidium botryosum FD-172 SS1]